MKILTNEQIDKLASRKGVRKVAVENFLGTLYENCNRSEQMANMYQDAAVYRWNGATVNALRAGIDLAYR